VRVPITPRDEVDWRRSAQAALGWLARTPAIERIQYMFRLKNLLERKLQGHRAHDHAGVRQDAGRGEAELRPRDRECRGGLRHPMLMQATTTRI